MPKGHYVHRQSEPSQQWVIYPGVDIDLLEDPHIWVYPSGPGYEYSLTYDNIKLIVTFSDGPSTGTVVLMTEEYLDRTLIWDEVGFIEKEKALEKAVEEAKRILTKHSTG